MKKFTKFIKFPKITKKASEVIIGVAAIVVFMIGVLFFSQMCTGIGAVECTGIDISKDVNEQIELVE